MRFVYGAILGDIIGEPYEAGGNPKTKDFPLFCAEPRFTDDSVMTIAVCEGISAAGLRADERTMKAALTASMLHWGRNYPSAGYGEGF